MKVYQFCNSPTCASMVVIRRTGLRFGVLMNASVRCYAVVVFDGRKMFFAFPRRERKRTAKAAFSFSVSEM